MLAEFARRRQHQRLHVVPFRVKQIEEWQSKGGGFAGACLGQTNEIPVSLKQQRNGLRLNVGGRLEAHLGDGFQQGGGEPKGVKCVQKEGNQGAKVAHSRLNLASITSRLISPNVCSLNMTSIKLAHSDVLGRGPNRIHHRWIRSKTSLPNF